jgi:hypothetical protein
VFESTDEAVNDAGACILVDHQKASYKSLGRHNHLGRTGRIWRGERDKRGDVLPLVENIRNCLSEAKCSPSLNKATDSMTALAKLVDRNALRDKAIYDGQEERMNRDSTA